MDYRTLVNKLENIEKGINEALSQDQINAALQGKTDPNQRASLLSTLAMQNGLPGLYDPQSGVFVKATSPGQPVQTTQQGDPTIDKQLAAKGLVPNYARLGGDASNEFERGAQQSLRTQSASAAGQATGADVKKQLATLQQLVGELDRIQGSGFEKSYYYESISKNLVESFGYEVQDEGVGSLVGKALPGAGLVLGAADAYDRWQKGDKKGAALSGAGALASLIPGIGTAASLGIGAYQAANDNPDVVQAAKKKLGVNKPLAKLSSSNKVLDIQKKLIAKGAKIKADGIMGPNTRAAMKRFGVHEEFSVAESIRQIQNRLAILETDEVNPFHSDEVFNEAGEQEFDAFFQELNRLGGDISGEPGKEVVTLPGQQPVPFTDLVAMASDQELGEGVPTGLLSKGYQFLARALAPVIKSVKGFAGKSVGVASDAIKKGAGAVGKTAKRYPKTAAGVGVAAGLGAAALSGDDAGAGGAGSGKARGGAGSAGGATAAGGSAGPERLPLGQNLEVQEIVRQMKPVIASLRQHLVDPNVRNAVADAEAKLMGIKGLPRA